MRVNISNDPAHTDFIQIDGPDIWSMDHTLSRLILPMLLMLKEVKHGIPGECMPDFHRDWRQYTFDFIDNDTEGDLSYEIGLKRWNTIMDEMIWSFQEVESGRWGDPSYGATFPGGHIVYNARVSKGLKHFGEFYGSLWD